MALSKIKAQHKNTYVAFGNSNQPLGSNPNIDDLAIMAHETNSGQLKDYFEELPPLDQLKKAKTDAELNKLRPSNTTTNEARQQQTDQAKPAATSDGAQGR